MADVFSQILSNVLLDGLVDILVGVPLLLISYWRFGKKLVFKLIIAIFGFVVFAAEATVLITSFQILAPDQYLTALVIILPVGSIILFGISYYFLKVIIQPLNKITTDAKALAEGDLTVKIEKTSRVDEIGSLTNSLHELFELLNIKAVVEKITESVQSLNGLANNLASSSEEINASTEEISSTIQEISSASVKQNNLITNVLSNGSSLQEQFRQNSLNLRKTSSLIEGINNKINLLALNASIEAARAGEYGRGFAIVAENIRQLADESKDSLTQSNELIAQLEKNLNSNIQIINKEIKEISEASENTTAGTEEMAASVEEFTASIQELSEKAIELAQISQDLSNLTNNFTKLKDGTFIN